MESAFSMRAWTRSPSSTPRCGSSQPRFSPSAPDSARSCGGSRAEAPASGTRSARRTARMPVMRHWEWLVSVALALASIRAQAAPPTPIVVELFTSEGCSDCPPADTLLEKLIATQPVAGAEIIALGEHVDYWDRLGWKDRFSSAAVTSRQQGYQTHFGTESIYTPQMVVDGRAELVGSDANAARKAIERALIVPHGVMTLDVDRPTQTRDRDAAAIRVKVSANNLAPIPKGDHADIIVLVTESGLRTDVKRGENHGRTLSHAPV